MRKSASAWFAALLLASPSLRAQAWICFDLSACIDGSDFVYVQPLPGGEGGVYYEHRNWTAPGWHLDCGEPRPVPTTVNGREWVPDWPQGTCNGCRSDTFLFQPGMPMTTAVRLVPVESRGSTTLVQSPDPGNSWTTVVLLDDDAEPGAVTYRFQLICDCPTFDFDPAWDITDDPCTTSLHLEWSAATFPSGAGVYNLYRGEGDCADALARAPLARGLTTTAWTDSTTQAGGTYVYAVEAEDGSTDPPCGDGPDHGGVVAASCLGARRDVLDTDPPPEVGNRLRATDGGQDFVAFRWSGAPPLEPGDHYHVWRTTALPGGAWTELDRTHALRTTSFRDDSAPDRLYYYVIRAADLCEND